MRTSAQRPLTLIDGDCGVCQKAGGLLRRLTKNRVEITPWQAQSELPPGITREKLADALAFVGQDGEIFWGAAAIASALKVSPVAMIRLCGRSLDVFPVSMLANSLYRIVANNRHKISRMIGAQACKLPPPVTEN